MHLMKAAFEAQFLKQSQWQVMPPDPVLLAASPVLGAPTSQACSGW